MKVFLLSIGIGCTSPAIGRALGVLREPRFPALLTSLFVEPELIPLPLKLLFGYIHMHMNAFHYLIFAFNLMAVVYYNYGFVIMMRRLKVREDGSISRHEHLEEKALLYRQLTIIQTVYNSIFSSFLVVVKVLGIFSSVMNLFMAVAHQSFKGLIVGSFTLVICFILCNTLAQVYEESLSVKQSWKLVHHFKWLVKFVKSARSQAVTVGSYYFVDRGLLFTVLDIIFSNTANLILTYRA